MMSTTLQTTIALLLFLLIALIVAGLYQSPASGLLGVSNNNPAVIVQDGATLQPTQSTITPIATTAIAPNSGGGQNLRTHTVQSGEGLWQIARRYDTSIDAILALNPEITDPDQIQSGQELVISRP